MNNLIETLISLPGYLLAYIHVLVYLLFSFINLGLTDFTFYLTNFDEFEKDTDELFFVKYRIHVGFALWVFILYFGFIK